jgi:hypothetical protein
MEASGIKKDWSVYGKRAAAFKQLAAVLPPNAVVVETGTARSPYDTMGNGASTILWDQLGYEVHTVDIDQRSQHAAKKVAPKVNYYCDDSVNFLEERADLVSKADLLYLDSMDYSIHNKAIAERSELHHLHEIKAAFAALKPGALIAVDDCHSDKQGKHVLVEEFLTLDTDQADMVEQVSIDGYVRIWRKRSG